MPATFVNCGTGSKPVGYTILARGGLLLKRTAKYMKKVNPIAATNIPTLISVGLASRSQNPTTRLVARPRAAVEATFHPPLSKPVRSAPKDTSATKKAEHTTAQNKRRP